MSGPAIPRAKQLRAPARLAALRETALLDTPPEEAFDRLTRLAARLLVAPVAVMSLVDADRQFFKSHVGLPEPLASTREASLCEWICCYEVVTGLPFIVPDARAHRLLAMHAAVVGLGAASYLGVPLVTRAGHTLGALCVSDTKPRDWTTDDVASLADLAACAMTEVELRAANRLGGRPALPPEDRRPQT